MSKCGVFAVTSNETFRRALQTSLLGLDVNPSIVMPGANLAPAFRKRQWQLVVVGPVAAECDDLEIVRMLRSVDCHVPMILVTTSSSEGKAIAALRAKVTDYFSCPVCPEELRASIKRLTDCQQPAPPDTPPQSGFSSKSSPMLGCSASVGGIRHYIEKVAQTNSHILITGETGTGKELAAAMIHSSGPRRHKPFVCINCAALPEGLLESELFGHEKGAFTGADSSYAGQLRLADGGTAFFDEIGDMSPLAQAKILRLIETKEIQGLGRRWSVPVDIRIISATNRNLEKMMEEGSFRKDLYFRLNVARIHLPPLRERKEDIPVLLSHYLREFNERMDCEAKGVSEEVAQLLLNHSWPGNIRELKNLLEVSLIDFSGGDIGIRDLPQQFRVRVLEMAGSKEERERLLSILFSTGWNKSEAAKKLNWSRMTLYRKMARYQIPQASERRTYEVGTG